MQLSFYKLYIGSSSSAWQQEQNAVKPPKVAASTLKMTITHTQSKNTHSRTFQHEA